MLAALRRSSSSLPSKVASDLDELLEYGLARHLDGFAALVGDQA